MYEGDLVKGKQAYSVGCISCTFHISRPGRFLIFLGFWRFFPKGVCAVGAFYMSYPRDGSWSIYNRIVIGNTSLLLALCI